MSGIRKWLCCSWLVLKWLSPDTSLRQVKNLHKLNLGAVCDGKWHETLNCAALKKFKKKYERIELEQWISFFPPIFSVLSLALVQNKPLILSYYTTLWNISLSLVICGKRSDIFWKMVTMTTLYKHSSPLLKLTLISVQINNSCVQ